MAQSDAGQRSAVSGRETRRAIFLDRDGVLNRVIMCNGTPHPPAAADEVDYKFPDARMNVALAAARAIKKNVEEVAFVEQEKIEMFQYERLDWVSMPMSEIADMFGAGRVLYLDMYQFDMYEEDNEYLLRGRISATVRVYERNGAQADQAVYRGEAEAVYPKHQPVAASDSAMLSVQVNAIHRFAEQVARKFYDHKVKVR